MARPYRNRKTRKPTGKKVSVTPLVLKILEVIHKYPHIDTRDIIAHTGANATTVRWNLREIFKETMWVERPFSPLYHDCHYKLLPAGEDVLKEKGLYIPKVLHPERSPSGAHDHHAHKVVSGMELSAKKLGWNFHHIEDLIHHPKLTVPEITNFSFPVGDVNITPDYRPVAIESPEGFYFLPGIEYGTGSEDNGTKKRTSTKTKLEHWVQVVSTHAYKAKYGFPSLMVPFILPGPRSLDAAIAQLLKIMPQGCNYILFTWVPYTEKDDTGLPVLDDMLTRSWKRAGRPDFYFTK